MEPRHVSKSFWLINCTRGLILVYLDENLDARVLTCNRLQVCGVSEEILSLPRFFDEVYGRHRPSIFTRLLERVFSNLDPCSFGRIEAQVILVALSLMTNNWLIIESKTHLRSKDEHWTTLLILFTPLSV